jgi:hypothetical protein
MRRRLRSHLTFANVVSAIALFVALGGTAAAGVIITSNSEVAQGTISGHNPPSGDHANIISGSVNQSDLAPAAVLTGKLADDSVIGAKVLNHSLTKADIAGADVSGAISINSVAANGCGSLNFGISGAQVGDVVLMSFEGNTALPAGLIVEPLKVTAANTVAGRVCNVTNSASAAVSNLGVRVMTFR